MADDCSWYDVTCQLGNLTEQTASTVTDAIVSTWAKAVLEGLDSVLTTLGTFWVKVPTPDVSDSGSVTAWAQGATHWLVIVLAALSTLTACIYLMWHQRGEEVRNIVRGLLTLIIVSAVSITMGQAVIDVADKSATWFLDQATGDPSSNFATKLLTISTIDPGGTTLIVAIVMGLIGLLANLVQMGMMFVRSAMVILLLSAIPLAAATTMTEWGQQWLKKMVGWFIAFAAMKPVAALIYGIAIKLVEGDSYDITDDGELLKFVLGTIMMVLAAPLPPRARGKRLDQVRRPAPLASTPACAGQTGPTQCWAPSCSLYPRVRGANAVPTTSDQWDEPLPPRARGKLTEMPQKNMGKTSTPACAGQTASSRRV